MKHSPFRKTATNSHIEKLSYKHEKWEMWKLFIHTPKLVSLSNALFWQYLKKNKKRLTLDWEGDGQNTDQPQVHGLPWWTTVKCTTLKWTTTKKWLGLGLGFG